MKYYWLILSIFGVWQITHLLHGEEGPWAVLARLRELLKKSFLRKAVFCFYCMSMWVAFPVAVGIGETWPEKGLLWVALAGASSLLERATQNAAAPPVIYYEDSPTPALTATAESLTRGDNDVQLRQ